MKTTLKQLFITFGLGCQELLYKVYNCENYVDLPRIQQNQENS